MDKLINIPVFLSTSNSSRSSGLDCTTTCMSCQATPMDCGNVESECDYCQGISCEVINVGPCATICMIAVCQSTCESLCNSRCQGCEGECQKECQRCMSGCEVVVQRPKPALWSWSISNKDASASQTSDAYTAINNHGMVKNFNYLVWNDLVNKVESCLQYKSTTWATNTGVGASLDYYETLMSSTDRTLTAARFNSLKYNLDRYYSSSIAQQSTGDVVKGEYFNKIANAINGWIGGM